MNRSEHNLLVEVNGARPPHTCSRPFAFEKKTQTQTRNSAASETHHEFHSSPTTAITSRRRWTKHVPRVSSYLPASIDPGFVEIGLVQLSQSVKNTNVTDKTIKIMQPCTHPGMKRLFCLIGKKTASVASLPRPCLILTRVRASTVRTV